MDKQKVVYGIYINASAEKIWDALTKSEYVCQYFWGMNVESDWKVGSIIRGFMDDGTTVSKSEILKIEPGKLLTQIDRGLDPDAAKGEESVVTFEIEQHGDLCKLIVTHEHNSEAHKNAMNGWEMSMGSLKSLLETGNALPFSA